MIIPIEIAWLLAIHAVLYLICEGYARILNRRRVYEWYHPKWTWFTVVIGEAIVGIAFGGMCVAAARWIAAALWLPPLLFFTAQLAGGLPIVAWQRRQARELELTERRLRERE